MKRLRKKLPFAMCLILVLSSMTFIHASEADFNSDNGYATGLTGEATENGFDGVVSNEYNPKARAIESGSYTRNASYLVWAEKKLALYANHTSNSKKLGDIPANEVMNGTSRYGDYIKVSSTKGSGWVKIQSGVSKLMETESMNQTFRTTVTCSLYTQPFITSKFKTAKKVPAGTYQVTKRANYFVYINNGTYKGWIMTQYKDNGDSLGKVAGFFPSTKGSLGISDIDGIPLKEKLIPKITDLGRPGIQMIPKYVTIHNTGNTVKGADAKSHADLQYRGNSRSASWHFQVDKNSIYQSLPMNEIGWHAGDGNTMGNASTIGIEICENSDGNYAQSEKNAAKLTARLLVENKLPYNAVRMHRDWSGKNCPQNIIEGTKGTMGWSGFMAAVKKEYNRIMPTMSISSSSASVGVNDSFKLNATLSSNAIDKSLRWSSSNPSVASVDQLGVVKGLADGVSNISVTNAYGKTLTCKVEVSNISEGIRTTLTALNLKLSGNNVNGFVLGSNLSTLTTELSKLGEVTCYDSSGNVISATTVATGQKVSVKILEGETSEIFNLNIVIRGDVNGDGRISSIDYSLIKNDILKIGKLSGPKAKAADINNSVNISSIDYSLVKNDILNISKIIQ